MSELDLSILKPYNLYILDPNRDGVLTLEETKDAEAKLNAELKLEPDNSLINEELRSANLALTYIEQMGNKPIKYFLGFDVDSDGQPDITNTNDATSTCCGGGKGLSLYFDNLGDNNGIVSLKEMLIMSNDDKRPYNYEYKKYGNIDYIEINFLDNGTLYPDMAFSPDLHYIISYKNPSSLNKDDKKLLEKTNIKIKKEGNKYSYTTSDGKPLSLFEIALRMEMEYFLEEADYQNISEVNRLKKLFKNLGYVPLYNGNYGVDDSFGYIDLDLYNLNTGLIDCYEIEVYELNDRDDPDTVSTVDIRKLITFFDNLKKKSYSPTPIP